MKTLADLPEVEYTAILKAHALGNVEAYNPEMDKWYPMHPLDRLHPFRTFRSKETGQ